MSFALPSLLLALLLPAALVAAYLWQQRRRRRTVVIHPDLALLRSAGASRRTWRRHIPVALVAAALLAFGVGAARPQVSAEVPISASSIIVALDVSGSMCATDVAPNRLTAATEAVRTFVAQQQDDTRIGLVLFSGSSQLAVAPTTERADLVRTLDTLSTGRGTTIGAAILTSVDAIAGIDATVAPIGSDEADGPIPAPQPAKVPEIVVLLTDGANTNGVTPELAARLAASRGVRVYPIGFGTTTPTSMACTAEQAGSRGGWGGGWGRGGNGGGRNFLRADEPALRQVAEITGGTFFAATDAGQLNDVFADLPRHVQVQRRDVDVSAALVALGMVLMLAGTLWQWRSGALT